MPSTINQYTCQQILGRGGFGVVRLATTPDGNQVALKIFRQDDPRFIDFSQYIQSEAFVLGNLNHPHIVRIIEHSLDAVQVQGDGRQIPVAFIALELCLVGELFTFIQVGPFSPEVCRYFFNQALQAVHFMNTNGYTHRDLKLENMLLDENYNLKIADFGFAYLTQGRDGTGFLNTFLGTKQYMAPEIILGQAYQGHQVDLFALGVILFLMYSGHVPFDSAELDDVNYRLIQQDRADIFWLSHSNRHLPGFYSEDFKDLITSMLSPNPVQRLSLAEIIGHQWMQNPIATQEQVRQEFEIRRQQIIAQEAQQVQQVNQANQHQNVHQHVNVNNGIYMSSPVEEIDTQCVNPAQNQLQQYQNPVFSNTLICSSLKPEFIFSTLEKILQDIEDIDTTSNLKKWKIRFELKSENEMISGGCQGQIKLFKIKEDKVCIEFLRLAGCSWKFFALFTDIKEKVQFLNDVAYDFQ